MTGARGPVIRRCVAAMAALGFSTAGVATGPVIGTFGSVGLLQTPTARQLPEGSISVGYSSARPYDSVFVSAYPYDWLEAVFRYTTLRYSGLDGDFVRNGFLDKSFELKLRLLSESAYMPRVAIGATDIGGTGLLASEYLVASKRLGSLDVSLGLGWGRLGARGTFDNPLSRLGERFEVRPDVTGEGGELEGGRAFSGEGVALFGGVAWSPTGSRWQLVAEYEGNDYSSEPFENVLRQDWPVNVGVAYRGSNYRLNLGLERGRQLGFGVSVFANVSEPGPQKVLDPPATPVAPPSEPIHSISDAESETEIRAALSRQDVVMLSYEVDHTADRATVWVANSTYREAAQLVGRVARSVSMLAGVSVDQIRVVLVDHGLELAQYDLSREDVRLVASGNAIAGQALFAGQVNAPDVRPADDPALGPKRFPNWSVSFGPRYRQGIGDPDDSYRAQLSVEAGARLRVTTRWSWSASVELGVAGNLDEIERESDSQLPRVRSDIAQYYREGEDGIRVVETNYVFPVTGEVYGRVSAGLFEQMYGGIAAEVLFRPFLRNWALGLNINRVRQRSFDGGFGFRDYEVSTGHLTLYQRLPRLGVDATLSVGRYLAGDVGGTISLARTFESGASIGAFATKTDVSAEQFGEGSFDKGFFISIPFDLFVPRSSRRTASVAFRPLTRDGGQMVRDGRSLYGLTARGDVRAVYRGAAHFTR